MHRGGGRFSRFPPSRWPPGPHHHPYRGGAPGFRPSGFGRGFHGVARDNGDGGNFAKLFVAAVPKTATEEELKIQNRTKKIRLIFEEHGDVIEVAFIKDRRTGQQQSCCFVKYATLECAERAIAAFHNQYTLPGGSGPIQVRFADGERERLGAFEVKLYVGSLNKQATEKEIEEIFEPYGGVDDVFVLRDDMKQSRGCCFVKLRNKEMAAGAINALHGSHVMSERDLPLIVRFADPKKPRPGELRGGPMFGVHGFHPRSQATLGHWTTPAHTEPQDGHIQPNASRPISPRSPVPPSQTHSIGVPADTTNVTQSSLAVPQSLSQQVHQLEQMQIPLSDSQSSIQQNIPSDDMQTQQDAFAISKQPSGPKCSMSGQLLQLPPQQSPSSLAHEVFIQQSLRSDLPQSASSACSAPLWSDLPQSASSACSAPATSTLPLTMCTTFRIACRWSEHTCPDGFKYYYNCITRESRWEKPDEYVDFEEQQQRQFQQQREQQKRSNNHPNSPSCIDLHSQHQPIQASQ